MACRKNNTSVVSEAPPIASLFSCDKYGGGGGGGSSSSSETAAVSIQLETSYEEDEDEDVDQVCPLLNYDDSSVAAHDFNTDIMDDVKAEDVQLLLRHFSKHLYRAKSEDKVGKDIMKKCLSLFAKDYQYFVIDNDGGQLSTYYPSKLVILEYEKSSDSRRDSCSKRKSEADSLYESIYDLTKLQDLCQRARFARCRARFPVPVILLDGKNICRSATLSGGAEIYGRTSYDYFFPGRSGNMREDEVEDDDEDDPIAHTSSDWQLFDRVRSQDIRLLKQFSVTHICDLMVEKKKVKFGVNITSSEKVDKENRYNDFIILSLPYPGCEFFREYSANGYNAVGLVYAWNQAFVDALLEIPDDSISARLDVDWKSYKTWDVIKLTQQYFKLILKYISNGNGGMLIHCISGWDRTPLFISLLRISLWASGDIHSSLAPIEILYLTLAYDWYLFGHNLPDRIGKGEEIMFFCFDFLKWITSDEYSLHETKHIVRARKTSDVESGVVDDILMESNNVCGSNTSLNSSCSSVSNRSQDCPPQFFTISSESSDEAANTLPSSGGGIDCISSNQRPFSSPRDEQFFRSQSSTTPVAVPTHFRKHSEQSSGSSVGCGSWQIISGTGSLRGSTSARCDSTSSPHSSSSGEQQSHYRLSRNSLINSYRTRRLKAVRHLFYDNYVPTVGFRFCNGTDSASGGFSGLLDHFAEKVGIRTGRPAQ